jgi:putative transcriptional regulator
MTIARKAALWLVLLLASAAVTAMLTASADNALPPPDPPAGQLLIASAAIQDPRFFHSVILLLHHDKQGAFGIMINRPLGKRPLASILTSSDGKQPKPDEDAAISGTIEVFVGGPVQLEAGLIVHSADYHRGETLTVTAALAMTATRDVLRDIGHRKGPAKYLFAIGYSGWGAGQLEAEIARHDWFTEPATPDLVFDADRAGLWEKALGRRTREL